MIDPAYFEHLSILHSLPVAADYPAWAHMGTSGVMRADPVTIAIQIGLAIISYVAARMMAPGPQDQSGARKSDLSIAKISPGAPIPRLWGTARISGMMIWKNGLTEVVATEEISGGKGGGKSATATTYTYEMDGAWSLCEGPIGGVRRLWANGKLLWSEELVLANLSNLDIEAQGQVAYDTAYQEAERFPPWHPDSSHGVEYQTAILTSIGDAARAKKTEALYQVRDKSLRFESIEFFPGNEDQLPSQIMEEIDGAGNVPAYRGTAYVVIKGLILTDFGNVAPGIEAEVVDGNGSSVLITAPEGSETHIFHWVHWGNGINATRGAGYTATYGAPAVPLDEVIVGGGFDYAAGGSPASIGNIMLGAIALHCEKITALGLGNTQVTLVFSKLDNPFLATVPSSWGVAVNAVGLDNEKDRHYSVTFKAKYFVTGAPAPFACPAINASYNDAFLTPGLQSLREQVEVAGPGAQVYIWSMSSTTNYESLAYETSATGVRTYTHAGKNSVVALATFWDHLSAIYRVATTLVPIRVGGFAYSTSGSSYTTVLTQAEVRTILDAGVAVPKPSTTGFAWMGNVWSKYPSPLPNGYASGIDFMSAEHSPNLFPSTETNKRVLYFRMGTAYRYYAHFGVWPWDVETDRDFPFASLSDLGISAAPNTGVGGTADATVAYLLHVAPPLGTYIGTIRAPITEIISNLCTSAGMVEGDHFVLNTDMQGMDVGGFVLSSNTSAREALTQLMMIAPFDAVETGSQLKFIPRDGPVVAVLREQDFRAGGDATRVTQARVDDAQLPEEIRLTYLDSERDGSNNVAVARREFTKSTEKRSLDLPVTDTPSTMRMHATRAMAYAMASRRGYKVTLPHKYMMIEPGDIVELPVRNARTDEVENRIVRVVGWDLGADLTIKANFEDYVRSFDGITIVLNSTPYSSSLDVSANVVHAVFEIPQLTDVALETGYWVVMGSSFSSWKGALLFRDLGTTGTSVFGTVLYGEGDANLALAASCLTRGQIGVAPVALADGPHNVVDRDSDMLVRFSTYGSNLNSIPADYWATSLSNTFLVGSEVVQAYTVERMTEDVYILSDLRRGIGGTEGHCASHLPNERVVLLNEASMVRVPLTLEEVGQSLTLRSAASGDDVTVAEAFTYDFLALSDHPLPPEPLRAVLQPNGDVLLSFSTRARGATGFTSGAETPEDAGAAGYRVDVRAALGGAVLRTALLALADVGYTYLLADRTSDGTDSAETLHVTTRSISADLRITECFPSALTLSIT
jgi:hypothetical protein